MITAVSSIDSVVWVTKATCVGSRMSSRANVVDGLDQVDAAAPLASSRRTDPSCPRPRVATVPDQDHLVALAAVARHSRCTW